MEDRTRGNFEDLPIGFAMSLLQNGPAMTAFSGLDQIAREKVVARARSAQSKAEMRNIVDDIGKNTTSM